MRLCDDIVKALRDADFLELPLKDVLARLVNDKVEVLESLDHTFAESIRCHKYALRTET